QRRIGRRLAPRKYLALKVAVKNREGISRVRMAVPSFGQDDNRAEIHRTAPELRQPVALDSDPLDVLRLREIRKRPNPAIERDPHDGIARRVDSQALRRAGEIAWRDRPLLSFAAVRRQLDGVAVASPEGLVHVEESLHP